MHVSIHNLNKSFGSVTALEDVSCEIAPGEIIAVLSCNGAAQNNAPSQACRNRVAPNCGEIRYDGEIFRRDRMDLRRRFFFLPDSPPVIPSMTVLRHIGMVVRLYAAERQGLDNEIVELLQEFDILPLVESLLGTLSRGQTYKTALAALLAVNPELWMIDEPFASGIDPLGIAAFRRHARAAVAHGGTVIYTTQIMELAAQFSDRICALDRGRVVGSDSVDRLKQTATSGTPLRQLLDTLYQNTTA